MFNTIYPDITFLTNNLIRMMTEKYNKNPLTAELQNCQNDFSRALLFAERNALFVILEDKNNTETLDNLCQNVTNTKTALLKKIHETIIFLYGTAKEEKPIKNILFDMANVGAK